MHVIDLDKTATALEKALHMIRGVVEARGSILFVNTRSQVCPLAAAPTCHAFVLFGVTACTHPSLCLAHGAPW